MCTPEDTVSCIAFKWDKQHKGIGEKICKLHYFMNVQKSYLVLVHGLYMLCCSSGVL